MLFGGLGGQSAFAQKATGEIYGHAGANSKVKIESLDTGIVREETAHESGSFKFERLPVGRYKVTTDKGTQEVQVTIGRGVEVKFEKEGVETLEVTGRGGAVNAIDVNSVESTTVFSAAQIDSMPIARDLTSVALLAPGTVRGDGAPGSSFGSLASFGGASVAENGYFVNGFDVTNLRAMMSYANLPFDAIAEQQVKTGGYGAEFGRSMGGIINIVTKRGTNEWKGGASTYWTPKALRNTQPNIRSNDPSKTGMDYFKFSNFNTLEDLQYNAYVGGPILKDKLFFFGLVNGQNNVNDNYSRDTSNNSQIKTAKWLAKLDWNITDNHLFEYTNMSTRANTRTWDYINSTAERYSSTHKTANPYYELQSGGLVHIAKYTGYFGDDFTASIMGATLKNLNYWRDRAPAGAECPNILDSRTVYTIGGKAVSYCMKTATIERRDKPNSDIRDAIRADFEYSGLNFFGEHGFRFGYDYQLFRSTQNPSTYSGGAYYRYFNKPSSGKVNGIATTTQYVRKIVYQSTGGTFDVKNTAAYLEDNYQVLDNLKLYLAVRMETFENKNSDKISFVKSKNLFMPRLGSSWDVDGDSKFKVFGTWGRYYIPVPSKTNILTTSASGATTTYHTFSGWSADGTPIITGKIGDAVDVYGGGYTPTIPNPKTVVDMDLKPMHQDELILGTQKLLFSNWILGARGIYRKVKDGMDDVCYRGAFEKWGLDNGYTQTQIDNFDVPGCYLMNPGNDGHFSLDIDGNKTYVDAKIKASYWDMPKYKREYLAFELFWERVFDGTWYFQGSYTLAKNKGNAEGYVISTIHQADPGITEDWDYPSFTKGSDGNLPNMRRHNFKFFGSYNLDDNWQFSGNGNLQSGRPRSCLGFVDPKADGGEPAGYSTGSSFYCIKDGKKYQLGNRGDQGFTPWNYNIDLGVAYNTKISWLTDATVRLKLDIFNIFNFQKTVGTNDIHDINRQDEIVNPDYGLPDVRQSPRSVRISARYDF